MKVPMNEYENGLLDDCMLLLRMGNIYRKDGKELTLEKLYNDL